jgi:hypothetical protein
MGMTRAEMINQSWLIKPILPPSSSSLKSGDPLPGMFVILDSHFHGNDSSRDDKSILAYKAYSLTCVILAEKRGSTSRVDSKKKIYPKLLIFQIGALSHLFSNRCLPSTPSCDYSITNRGNVFLPFVGVLIHELFKPQS